MRITPLDVRKQEFRKVVRGYESDEVNAFLATVADEYEAVLRDNKELRERILDMEDKVSEYRTMEKTLRDTLMTAERVMNESKDNASREADLIIKDAELRAQQVLDSFRTQAEELRREIIELHKEREAYLARFRSLAEAQVQFVDNHQSDFEELDSRMMSLAQNGTQFRSGPRSVPTHISDNSHVSHAAPAQPTTPPSVTWPAAASPSAPVESAAASSPPPAPHYRQDREQDEWRDYTPGNRPDHTPNQPTAAPSDPGSDARSEDGPPVPPGTESRRPEDSGTTQEDDLDRQAEEVVEILSPMDEAQEAAGQVVTAPDGNRTGGDNPSMDTATAPEETKEWTGEARDATRDEAGDKTGDKTRDEAGDETGDENGEASSGKWNMETFTRGLSDL